MPTRGHTSDTNCHPFPSCVLVRQPHHIPVSQSSFWLLLPMWLLFLYFNFCLPFLLFLPYKLLKVTSDPFWKEEGGDFVKASLITPVLHLLRVGSSIFFQPRPGLAQRPPKGQKGLAAPGDSSSTPISSCCKCSHYIIPGPPRSKILLTSSWLHCCHNRLLLKQLCSASQVPLREPNRPPLLQLKRPGSESHLGSSPQLDLTFQFVKWGWWASLCG